MVTVPRAIFNGVDAEVWSIARHLGGTVGVAAKSLATGERFAFHAQQLFPAASTIKVPILVALLAEVRDGKFDLDEPVSLAGPRTGGGILFELPSVEQLSLRDAATLMIIVSDNYATNLVIDRVGLDRIQARIQEFGFHRTRLRRRMEDRVAAAQGMENVTTPHEMQLLFERLDDGSLLGPDLSRTALEILGRTQDVLGIRRQLPKDLVVQHKTGELDGVCHDVGIVRHPSAPFVFCAMLKDVNVQQGWDAIAEIARRFGDRAATVF
jgi:beta-lactamase class A